MQTPFVAFLLGENEKKIRQGVAVAGSPSSSTATGMLINLSDRWINSEI
jgi:hypothetical protein